MLPNIWAASVAVFSQDRSAPDQVLSFGVEWAGPEVVSLGDEPLTAYNAWLPLPALDTEVPQVSLHS